ncbi:MAG: zinc-dependent metalloprotease family protein [bacterium]|nr:zinc-dependent metalloprotease family protein [bacterium]
MRSALRFTLIAIALITLAMSCESFISNKLFAGTSPAVWSDIREGSFNIKGERRIVPANYRTVKSNLPELRSLLQNAPFEFTDRAKNSPLIIELPMPNGSMSKFSVSEYNIMESELAAKFPETKTYNIKGIDDPYATGKIDVTAAGFHGMVLSVRGNYFIDPYSSNEKEIYISYYKDELASTQQFECFTEANATDEHGINFTQGSFTTGSELRTYRLAMASTGEYTTFHGGTVVLGMAAITTAMNRVNGVYEKDLAVRMVLIANNDLLVYTTAATDPYTNNNGNTMLGQNQTNIDQVIGPANYDIGHVFSTGGGGVAFLGCVCSNGAKARGVTGLPSPTGDPFYIDYVAHEIGHQFSGNHSFNSQQSACGGGNRNAGTAWEPGSGSTIMGYAGICGSDNLQSNSDALFHTGNFTEMVIFTQLAAGSTCPVITPTGNTHPNVTVPASGFTIPVGTPFQLTGSATDAENPNSLTYIWEEMDLGPAGSPSNPTGTAPIFRSFRADTSSTRIFPRLSNLLANNTVTGERLPTYTRTLSFRLTVRDNAIAGGGVDYSLVEFNADQTAGPFLVTQPNTNVTWNSNVTQTVTWNVANTTAAPVSVANVNIKLSTDGGNTFPTMLAANTPNDGSQPVTVPSLNITNARIKVESIGNIFFDLSNTNFTITNTSSVANNGTGIPAEYSLSQNFPNPFNPSTKIVFDIPFNSSVILKIMDLSGREVATLVDNKFNAGSYTATFAAENLASGIYFYKIIANGEKQNFTLTKKMTLIK